MSQKPTDPNARKRIVFVGHDAAPSRCFRMIEDSLREQQVDPILFVGDGEPIKATSGEIEVQVESADLVVLGMSSNAQAAAMEIEAGRSAVKYSKPIALYGDVPGCYKRARVNSWFNVLALHVKLYLGTSMADMNGAASVFPNAKVVFTGNPQRELAFYPEYDAGYMRDALQIKDTGVHIILLCGGKDVVTNIANIHFTVEALLKVGRDTGNKLCLVFSPHPGDPLLRMSTQSGASFYTEILQALPINTITPIGFDTENLVTTASAVIDVCGTPLVWAACQRKPAFSLTSETVWRKVEAESSERKIEAIDFGTAREIPMSDGFGIFTYLLRQALEQGTPKNIQWIQESIYPKPSERGEAVRRICQALTSLG